MKHLIIKPIVKVSPSALSMWQNCQQQFYLLRMAGYPYVEQEQTEAMAYGKAFHAFICDHIARQKGIREPHLNLQTNINAIKIPSCKDKVVLTARKIAARYIKLGYLKEILDSDVSIEREIYKQLDAIPILGVIDLIVNGIPTEFKLRGFGSNRVYPVTPGYIKGTNINDEPLQQKPHQLLEVVNAPWAMQLTFYNWLVGKPGVYELHEIVCTDIEDRSKFQVAVHVGTITEFFQSTVKKALCDMWNTVNNLEVEIEEPKCSKWICHKYGSTCPVTDKCLAYQNWMKTLEIHG